MPCQTLGPEEVPTLSGDAICVSKVTENAKLPGLSDARPWRTNLAAASLVDPSVFFVAVSNRVHCYRKLHPHEVPREPFGKLRMHWESSGIEGGGTGLHRTWDYDGPEGAPINSIRVGELGAEEVLVAVDDLGQVRVWFTSDLQRPPIRLCNTTSSWGIATNPSRLLLAVTANDHSVQIWPMADDASLEREPGTPDTPPTRSPATRTLKGHSHNVPCADFSPCGKYLASCSIDGTTRVWEVEGGGTVSVRNVGAPDREQWNWTVRFILQSSVVTLPAQTSSRRDSTDGSTSNNNRRRLSGSEDDEEPHWSRRTRARGLLGLVGNGLSLDEARWLWRRRQEGVEPDSETAVPVGIAAEGLEQAEGETDSEGWTDDGQSEDAGRFSMVEDGYTPMEAEAGTVEDYFGDVGTEGVGREEEERMEEEEGTDEGSDLDAAMWTDSGDSSSSDIFTSVQGSGPETPAEDSHFLLLQTTPHDLRLLHFPSLRTLAHLPRVTRLPVNLPGGGMDVNDRLLSQFDRCCFLEVLEQVGCAVVGSQRGRCAVVRVVRRGASYHLLRETLLPPSAAQTPRMPLLGIWSSWHGSHVDSSLDFYLLHLLYYDGTLCVYEVRRGLDKNPLSMDKLAF